MTKHQARPSRFKAKRRALPKKAAKAAKPAPPRIKRKHIPRPAESEILKLARRIRNAAEYLVQVHHYKIGDFEPLTAAEGLPPLHKNSLMRLRDLEISWMIRVPLRPGGQIAQRVRGASNRWVRATRDATDAEGSKAVKQWVWNPQIDTLERLEGILHEAYALGFRDDWQPETSKLSRHPHQLAA
jgi:hypothetical protein